ncbi:MAG: ArnT family glycosyltransferase [Chloroflexota bacterium]
MRKGWWFALVAGILLFLHLVNLSLVPDFWWDEGWTVNVARNWVERGVYGQMLNGELRPPGLSASFVNVIPIAVSFRLLGIGLWQARLVTVLFSFLALLMLFLLTKRLYNSTVGWGALFVVILMTPHMATNPVYMGRQVMAEMPLMFYLLLGYYAFSRVSERPGWGLLMVFSWGVALDCKLQPLPFWLVSLLLPLVLLLWRRERRLAAWLALGLIGSWVFSLALSWLWESAMQHIIPSGDLLSGLLRVLVFTMDASARQLAFWIFLLSGLPVFSGLFYGIQSWWKQQVHQASTVPAFQTTSREIAPVMLWIFSASWMAWYVLFSIGWARYLMPALFFGSPFLAAALYDWLDGYRLGSALQKAGAALRAFRLNGKFWLTLWALLSVVLMVYLTLSQFMQNYDPEKGRAVFRVARFVGDNTPPDALIETYDSELLFLIDRRFHYPPDDTNLAMIAMDADPDLRIRYDPLVADPDYIIVGRFSRAAKLYQDVVAGDRFRLIYEDGAYEVYEAR